MLEPPSSRAALAVGALLALVYLFQIAVHRRVRRRERWHGALADVAREGLLRLERDWTALDRALPPAERPPEEPDPEHAYARDLDVVGPSSLVRLLGPVTSEPGRAILRSWLLAPAPPDEAAARQGAVRELAADPELRAEVTAVGRLDGRESLEELGPFFLWAEGAPWILRRTWLRVASWVLPPIVVAGLVGYFAFGLLPWWILPALLQIDALRRVTPWARVVFTEAESGGPALRALVPQLALLDGRTWKDGRLGAISARLGAGEGASHRHLDRLSALLDTVESRRNFVYAALGPLLLLDIHLGVALDRWRAEHGPAVRDWLQAAGEWEALSALGTLAHDHPDWAFPVFRSRQAGPSMTGDGRTAGPDPTGPGAAGTDRPGRAVAEATLLEGRQLGHPLLRPEACVRNDVTAGPAGTFLFVTGSNMSGKSTLLRAIGTNAVLASAGAPVCCESLTLPPVRVHTSMRVDDSLAEGISLFMAELLRIKGIVQAAGDGGPGGAAASTAPLPSGAAPSGAAAPPGAAPPAVLYLLDEILHGTNTAERRVAARGVLRHLLASGAIGAISSHDLKLADVPDLAGVTRAVHFREHVEVREADGDRTTRLTFDYRLREGVATTRNALKLLEAVGLGDLARER